MKCFCFVQSTVDAVEAENEAEKHQLSALHQQRVVAHINEMKREAMTCYTRALRETQPNVSIDDGGLREAQPNVSIDSTRTLSEQPNVSTDYARALRETQPNVSTDYARALRETQPNVSIGSLAGHAHGPKLKYINEQQNRKQYCMIYFFVSFNLTNLSNERVYDWSCIVFAYRRTRYRSACRSCCAHWIRIDTTPWLTTSICWTATTELPRGRGMLPCSTSATSTAWPTR